MSRSAVATPSKQAVKKVQSVLKTLVTTYGTLIQSWFGDSEEIVRLLDHVRTLVAKRISIEAATSQCSFFSEVVVVNHDGIGQKLVSSVLLELESTLLQIKTFEKRMKDTYCAMMMTYEDAMKVVLNESMDIFDESSIFTAEHALDIQQLQKWFGLEIERKTEILSSLFACGEKLNDSIIRKEIFDVPCPTLDAISSALDLYPDTASESPICIDTVELFLQRNNIRDSTPHATVTR